MKPGGTRVTFGDAVIVPKEIRRNAKLEARRRGIQEIVPVKQNTPTRITAPTVVLCARGVVVVSRPAHPLDRTPR